MNKNLFIEKLFILNIAEDECPRQTWTIGNVNVTLTIQGEFNVFL